MASAKNRAIDLARRASTYERQREEVAHELGIMLAKDGASPAAQADDEVGDDLLALMFTCCHPALSPETRVALALRLLGGPTRVSGDEWATRRRRVGGCRRPRGGG